MKSTVSIGTVHEFLVALHDALDEGRSLASADLDWILLCALGLDSIGTTEGLSLDESRLYTAVRALVIEAEWRIPDA